MTRTVLLVTPTPGADECATAIGRQLDLNVELATSRRSALASLRRREYAALVVDEVLIESDPAGTEVLWQQGGVAVPLQVNFGISGCNRVLREVRAALHRREKEVSLAMRAAARLLESEMNTAITGLLLQAQLALAEPALPASAVIKLQKVVELAGSLSALLKDPPSA